MRNVLPILERELRVRSRRPLTYWLRLGMAAAGTLLVITTVGQWTGTGPGDLAFRVLGWFGFLLALAAAYLTVDAISSERRDGTLGLLFLTELNGVEVVLGKMAAAALSVVYIFAGFAPVLAVALLPGGVTIGEVARLTLVLIETSLLTLSLGLCVSACTMDFMQAIRRTTFWLVALVMFPMLAASFGVLDGAPIPWLGVPSPAAAFAMVGDLAYGAAPLCFWTCTALLLGETAALLVAAGRALNRNWSEEKAIVPAVPEPQTEIPPKLRTPLGDAEPIPWLVNRQRQFRTLFWIAAATALLIGSLGGFGQVLYSLAGAGLSLPAAFLVPFAALGNAAALGTFALAAGRFFLDARRTGSLELLLTTPVGVRDLLGGQKRALRQMLPGPLVVVLLPVFATMLVVFLFGSMGGGELPLWFAMAHVLSGARQALNVVAACWLGLWLGLRCRNAGTLMAWAAGLTVGLQWLVGLAFRLLIGFGGFTISNGTVPLAVKASLVLAPLCEWIPAITLIAWANHRVTRDLTGLSDTPLRWRETVGEQFVYAGRRLFRSESRAAQ